MALPGLDWESRIGQRVKLRDLHVLSAVVRLGSMVKAATHLAMSQSSVSEAIANLEDALRVRLLDRSPHGVAPTIYADALLRRGHAVFDELRQGISEIEFLAGSTKGEVRVACPELLSAGLLPAAIDRLSRQYPKIVVRVSPLDTTDIGIPGTARAKGRSCARKDSTNLRERRSEYRDPARRSAFRRRRRAQPLGAPSQDNLGRTDKRTVDLSPKSWGHGTHQGGIRSTRIGSARGKCERGSNSPAQSPARDRTFPHHASRFGNALHGEAAVAQNITDRFAHQAMAARDPDLEASHPQPGRSAFHQTTAGGREIDHRSTALAGAGVLNREREVARRGHHTNTTTSLIHPGDNGVTSSVRSAPVLCGALWTFVGRLDFGPAGPFRRGRVFAFRDRLASARNRWLIAACQSTASAAP